MVATRMSRRETSTGARRRRGLLGLGLRRRRLPVRGFLVASLLLPGALPRGARLPLHLVFGEENLRPRAPRSPARGSFRFEFPDRRRGVPSLEDGVRGVRDERREEVRGGVHSLERRTNNDSLSLRRPSPFGTTAPSR